MQRKPYDSELEEEFLKRVHRLMETLLLVFEYDWDHSKECIEKIINETGEAPNVLIKDYMGGNWCNQENLVNSFLELRAFMISEGLLSSDDD